jgi:hypothetical protein
MSLLRESPCPQRLLALLSRGSTKSRTLGAPSPVSAWAVTRRSIRSQSRSPWETGILRRSSTPSGQQSVHLASVSRSTNGQQPTTLSLEPTRDRGLHRPVGMDASRMIGGGSHWSASDPQPAIRWTPSGPPPFHNRCSAAALPGATLRARRSGGPTAGRTQRAGQLRTRQRARTDPPGPSAHPADGPPPLRRALSVPPRQPQGHRVSLRAGCAMPTAALTPPLHSDDRQLRGSGLEKAGIRRGRLQPARQCVALGGETRPRPRRARRTPAPAQRRTR